MSKGGGPGESRTPDTRFRKPLLYLSWRRRAVTLRRIVGSGRWVARNIVLCPIDWVSVLVRAIAFLDCPVVFGNVGVWLNDSLRIAL